MASIIEVKKGDTTRQMSEYSYMLLPYANGSRAGWVYVRHISGNPEGFDPAGSLNKIRATEQTTAMAKPFIPEEISKRLKTNQPGSDKKFATAIDPNAGATAIDPNAGATAIDPNAGATVDPNAGATVDPNAGATVDPNAGATVDPNAGAVTKSKKPSQK